MITLPQEFETSVATKNGDSIVIRQTDLQGSSDIVLSPERARIIAKEMMRLADTVEIGSFAEIRAHDINYDPSMDCHPIETEAQDGR